MVVCKFLWNLKYRDKNNYKIILIDTTFKRCKLGSQHKKGASKWVALSYAIEVKLLSTETRQF